MRAGSGPPLYPAAAKEQGIQGAVLLKAAIGVDGTVRELRVIDGPQLLAPAAVEPVKTRRPYAKLGKSLHRGGGAVFLRACLSSYQNTGA